MESVLDLQIHQLPSAQDPRVKEAPTRGHPGAISTKQKEGEEKKGRIPELDPARMSGLFKAPVPTQRTSQDSLIWLYLPFKGALSKGT